MDVPRVQSDKRVYCGKNKNNTSQPPDDPQIPQPDLRFASRKQAKQQQHGARPNTKQQHCHKGIGGSRPHNANDYKNMQSKQIKCTEETNYEDEAGSTTIAKRIQASYTEIIAGRSVSAQ